MNQFTMKLSIFFSTVLFLATPLLTQEKVKAVTYSPHTQYGCQMNMGPTGARAWMRGYHFVVMSIDQGSPSHGVLNPADVVIGVDDILFGEENDPRMTLGNAIGEAQADNHSLSLIILRGKEQLKISLKLPFLGEDGTYWPFNCKKSEQILNRACQNLIHAQLPSGQIVTDGDMGSTLGGLLMLASNNPNYLDGARRAAYFVADKERDSEGKSNNWTEGYGGLLLAEYFLATGDDSVLESLQSIVTKICEGQMKSGSWGHNVPFGAYGSLNQPGLICAITLTLAKECGLTIDPQAYSKALWFFSRFSELGAVPYGDHLPSTRSLDSNGRNATAAILMHLVGKTHQFKAYASSVAASYWEREEGHTGGFFSLTWGPLAVSLLGKEHLKPFMDYQKWYYNLSRTWRGDLVLLPYHEALTRFDGSTYNYFGGDFTTGGFGLTYALPHQHLRILGAQKSIFSPHSQPSGALLKAKTHYLNRQWTQCDKSLSLIQNKDLNNQDETRWFQQLKAARELNQHATTRILLEIDSNLVEGVPYRSSLQFKALQRCLGDEQDLRFEKVQQRLDGLSWHINEGKMYHEAWKEFRVISFKSWVPQGDKAKRMMEGVPGTYRPIWEPLSPTSHLSPQTWKTLLLEVDQPLPKGWMQESFDDSSWQLSQKIYSHFDALVKGMDEETKTKTLKALTRDEQKKIQSKGLAARRQFNIKDPEGVAIRLRLQTVRQAHTQVYLNGSLIVNIVRGLRGGYAIIPLDASALKNLKEGQNLLAITSNAQGKGNNHLDVGLEINRVPMELNILPTLRPSSLTLQDLPQVDNTMRVRQAKDNKLEELKILYLNMSTEQLLEKLKHSISFFRSLSENALVEKGLPGINATIPLLEHKDWKVRSSACSVLEKALKKDDAQDMDVSRTKIIKALPAIQELLQDQHHWVKVKACFLLRELGEASHSALPQLMELITDQDPWVRDSSFKAIAKIHSDPKLAMTATKSALHQPNSSFFIPGQALAILKKYPEEKDGVLDAIMSMLKNTPEGMGGGRVLRPMLDMAYTLDPSGEKMIPFLTEAIKGTTGLSHQQANPVGKALELLGSYGPKAASAIPALHKILASETKADKGRHDSARQALSKITLKEEVTLP